MLSLKVTTNKYLHKQVMHSCAYFVLVQSLTMLHLPNVTPKLRTVAMYVMFKTIIILHPKFIGYSRSASKPSFACLRPADILLL